MVLLALFSATFAVLISLPRSASATVLRRAGGENQGDLCYVQKHRCEYVAAFAESILTPAPATIVNNQLYFEGGEYTFKNGDILSPERYLHWLNLNASFAVDGLIPRELLNSVEVPGSQWTGQGAFFTDAELTTMYSFGGFAVPQEVNFTATVEVYNVTSLSWSNQSVSGGDFNGLDRSFSGSATTATAGLSLGFITGGMDAVSEPKGMIRFDTSDPSSIKFLLGCFFIVHTSKCLTQLIDIVARVGALVKAFLESLGNFTLRDMAKAMVYDLESQNWYTVTTTGDIPKARAHHCSVVSAAADDSSFQMTVYGGWDLGAHRAFEDVNVLTMPSFQWIKISDKGNQDSQIAGLIGRYMHTCESYGDRQMVILGGLLLNENQVLNNKSCDPLHAAIRVLDTTTFEWQKQFTPTPQRYEVPDVVVKVIGGSSSGRATRNTPSTGFNDSILNTVFGKTLPLYLTSTVKATSAGSNSSTAAPQQTEARLSKGAIAGIVVGAVVGLLAIIVALSIFLLRRKKQQPDPAAAEGVDRYMRQTYISKVHEVPGDDAPQEKDSGPLAEADASTPVFELQGK